MSGKKRHVTRYANVGAYLALLLIIFQRRKVQNRTAQRAYRERKEKALSDLRELLDHKESQYQTLQKEHLELQKKYTSLLKGSSDHESDEFKLLTCNPRECFQHKSSEDSLEGLLLQQDQG